MTNESEIEIKDEWETVIHKGGGTQGEITQRLKVPGGWLYKYTKRTWCDKLYTSIESHTMCFVPHKSLK